jgi:hypothetical protein
VDHSHHDYPLTKDDSPRPPVSSALPEDDVRSDNIADHEAGVLDPLDEANLTLKEGKVTTVELMSQVLVDSSH